MFQKLKNSNVLQNNVYVYLKLYNIHFMKNMTSNLASIVKQLLFYKSSVHQLCFYTYICSLYLRELYVRSLSGFEFQIQHSKLNNFGFISKLTQCRLHISYQVYARSCHLILIQLNKVLWIIVNKKAINKSWSQNFIFLVEKKMRKIHLIFDMP